MNIIYPTKQGRLKRRLFCYSDEENTLYLIKTIKLGKGKSKHENFRKKYTRASKDDG